MKEKNIKKFVLITFLVSFVGTISLFLNKNKNLKKFEINESNSDINFKREEA